MTQNSKFAIKILEKIGAPLAAALESVPLQVDDKDVEAAKLMAQMMGQAVQISIALNNSLNVTEDEEQADSTRLALAALAAPLIGEFYRQNARVPDDQDLKRIVKSQEAVLAFAENFTAADEGKSRLTTIDHDAPLFDKTQISLVVLQALSPVITAIFEFPFGQSETKLLQEVSDKLQVSAAEIVKKTGGDKLGEVMVVKALAGIYADCHRMETARLATASDENRGELSLDPVWEAYQTKLAMIEVIMGGDSEVSVAPVATAAVAEPATETPVPAPVGVESETQETPAAAPSSGGPMGFFKAGPKEEAAQAETPAAAVAPSVEAPAEAAVAPAPVEAPVETLAETPAPVAEASSAPQSAPPSGPMGFFKPGAKKVEDSGEDAS